MEGYYRQIPAAQHVSWQEFSRLEAERVEREYGSNNNGTPKEPVKRDMNELRSVLHNRPGR